MRRQFIALSVSICIAFSLPGCTPKPMTEGALDIEQSAIGVDLGHAGPFSTAATVFIGAPLSDGEASASPDDFPSLRITRGPDEDVGEVGNLFENTTKPLAALVTYHAFTPIVAETNTDAKSYWLVGVNMTRTPDRSVYIVLRYPKGLEIKPGLSSDAFEYTQLTCDNLEVARRPADYYVPQKEGAPEKPEPEPKPAPEAGPCEFNSLNEAMTMTALVLKRYDQIKHYDSAPSKYWQAVHVEVK